MLVSVYSLGSMANTLPVGSEIDTWSTVTDEVRNTEAVNNNNSSCPLWSVRDEKEKCKCGDSLGGIITCNRELHVLLLHKCYCMTYDKNGKGPFVGKCFYGCNSLITLADKTSDLIPISRNATKKDLNDIFCSSWNREGLMCGDCKPGFAPQAYSFDLKCVPCHRKNLYINVFKYIIAALFGPTVFLLIILAFRIKITSGKFNTFILFSQIVSAPPMVRSIFYWLEQSNVPRFFYMYSKIIISFYGIWNLDFFRPLLPSICLSILNTRETLSLDGIIAIYPMILLTIMYILITLYQRNCKIIVFIWKPFRVCFTRCRQIWEIRNSIVDTFAAFIILSYSKVLILIFDVTIPIALHEASGDKRYRAYYDASIQFLDKIHFIYILALFIMLLLFNALPVIILCLYPTKCGRRCCVRHGIIMQIFSDVFQGYFKDGTEGTYDLRFFPALYLLTRIGILLIYTTILDQYAFLVMVVVLMTIAILVLLLQPYKQQFNKYNRIDAIMIILLAMQILSANNVSQTVTLSSGYALIALFIAMIISLIPLFYIVIILIVWIVQRRRRCISGTYEALMNINE